MSGEETLRPLVTLYVDERRRRGELTHDTAKNVRSTLHGLSASFGARPLEQLGPRAVERWQESIGHLAPATRRSRLSYVKMFARWLVRRGVVRSDITAELPPVRMARQMKRALPAGHVARLLAACPDSRARVIVWLMVGCGLRCCEVAGLEVADYDERAATLFITGKGGHERVVPVPDEVVAAIDAYLAEVGRGRGRLIRRSEWWRKRHGDVYDGLAADTVGGIVVDVMKAAGIKNRRRDGVSAHALRHTAASDVLDGCKDLRVVQQMLGHANLATTAIYLREVDLGTMREAMAGRAYEEMTA